MIICCCIGVAATAAASAAAAAVLLFTLLLLPTHPLVRPRPPRLPAPGPLQDVRPGRARDGEEAVEGLLHHGGRRRVSRGRARPAALPGGEEGA